MVIHLFIGSLVFLVFGWIYGWEITRGYLLWGAFFGSLPDLASLVLKPGTRANKVAHKHRDNLTHSVFFPVIIAAACLPFLGAKWSLMIGVAVLSHLPFDLFGIGWGVKLFYPWSLKTYKLFYGGKILKIFNTPEEADKEAELHGMENWIKRVYFTFSPNFLAERVFGIMEWISLIAFIVLIFSF